MSDSQTKEFTQQDLETISLLSFLQQKKKQAESEHSQSSSVQGDGQANCATLVEQKLNLCSTISNLKKYLNMHGPSDPAPRILAKEYTPLLLHHSISLENLYASARRNQQVINLDLEVNAEDCKVAEADSASGATVQTDKLQQSSHPKARRRLQATCHLKEKMRLLPHLNEALELKDGKGKGDGGNQAKSDSNPLAKKINLSNKGPMPAPPNNSNVTGISISSGSYLNTNSNSQPTWKAMANGDQKSFYSNVFGDGNLPNQRLNDLDNGGKKRQRPADGGDAGFYEYGAGQGGNRHNHKPPAWDPNQNNGRKHGPQGGTHSSREIDAQYRHMSNPDNLSRQQQERIQRLMDQTDGNDLDPTKVDQVARYFQRGDQSNNQQWSAPGGGPPGHDYSRNGPQNNKRDGAAQSGAFQSGLTMFKSEQKKNMGRQNNYHENEYQQKQRQLEEFSTMRNNNNSNRGGNYNGGNYGGGGNGYGGYGGQNPNNNRQIFYGENRFDEPKESATDKFMNNEGRQPGIGGRRKFVPPTKGSENYGPGSGGQAGGFHPGRSVTQHMVKGANQGSNEEKGAPGAELPEEEQDERYKNLDPRMVELVENEIMERQLDITWDDIAGLEFAKKTINEVIIWPMLRPDIFKGIRAPPRGIMFFGPPGTGKTLLGKAIAAQSKSTFMSISASTLTSKWVGEGEKMVRTMFAIAAIRQPTVVFIDEIDSLLSARTDNDQEGSRRIKTEFLVQLDGANTFAGEEARILIIGATNRPDDLDEAVRRRLAKRLYIPLPNAAGRKQFLERLVDNEAKRNPDQSHIDLDKMSVDELTELTKGYSGADLKILSQEAAMMPLRSITDISNIDACNIRSTNLEDFKEALKNVKATVNQDDLQKFKDWNDKYGSFPISEEMLQL